MRPCNQCGAPISNRDLLCEQCETASQTDDVRQQAETENESSPGQPKIDVSDILWTAAEIAFRSVVIAVPVSLLGFLFFLVVAKAKIAIIAGIIFGLVCGLIYSLIAMYFQNGPYHR